MALTDKLSAIGDAIREKTGNSELLTLDAMPGEIRSIQSGGGELPEEALKITGSWDYGCHNGKWDWFFDLYGGQIKTENVQSAYHMFYNSKLTKIPFDFNFTGRADTRYMFYNCGQLENIGKLKNLEVYGFANMFSGCHCLRYLPTFENLNTSYINTSTTASGSTFSNCYSLRRVDENILKKIYNSNTQSWNSHFGSLFTSCYTLDEIKGLNFNEELACASSLAIGSGFTSCSRLKNLMFATNEDGTPKTAKWKNQTIDLGNINAPIGWHNWLEASGILEYNSGITADKEVKDDATYQALKNDPDWFTLKKEYSRFNHDSAVNTINSLPDTSAYLAEKGGTNTINFVGSAGSKTDGGAINTLTEAEIAVATAKGWTVTFV